MSYSDTNQHDIVYCYSYTKSTRYHDLVCTLTFDISDYLDGKVSGDQLYLDVKTKIDTLHQPNKILTVNSQIFCLVREVDYQLYTKLILLLAEKYESHVVHTMQAIDVMNIFDESNIAYDRKFLSY